MYYVSEIHCCRNMSRFMICLSKLESYLKSVNPVLNYGIFKCRNLAFLMLVNEMSVKTRFVFKKVWTQFYFYTMPFLGVTI